MAFYNNGGVRYFQFESLGAVPNLTHAVFTRQGGYSPAPWDSLNMGGLVGDDRQRVEQNRVQAFQALGRDPDSMYDVWQVHSAEVVCADAPRPKNVPHLKADAILTGNPSVTLFMRFADCVPIVLVDPVQRVVGLAHAGWQGTVKKVASAAIRAMGQHYGSRPGDIRAGIGPSIGVHHYPVGPEVGDQVRAKLGEDVHQVVMQPQNGSIHFDLWAANRILLEQAGVKHIEVASLCTACHLDDWYSHRAEQGKTGRFGALIGLKS